MSLCTLIPAIVGLISGILGYLIGKMASKEGSLSLQSDLDACKSNSKSLSAKISSLEAELAAAKTTAKPQGFASESGDDYFPFNEKLALSVFGKKINQDDLKIVEGIGPKIEQLYHASGIRTWKALSETSVEKSMAILNAAGEQYAIHNPVTWAKQAALAYQGKWKELKDWQNVLDGGKE
ncbi:MAG: hypothetical protein QM710_09510 [Flavobacterium sp.]